jgi:tetratricopeptide (TPR) repeat protein
VSTDRLRPLWDFSDLAASKRRLRAALAAEGDDAGRAEVVTQLARIAGLRGRYREGYRLLTDADALAGDDDVVRARVLLERGRLLRLSGDLAAALPLFEDAFEIALRAGQDFIAVDAAHMAALTADMVAWTQRGVELAERSDAAAPWIAMLLNNLGWWRLQRHEYAEALTAYQDSLAAHIRNADKPYLREVARCGAARALRGLGRTDEAVPLLEEAVAWAESIGRPDRVFHEELAAAYSDVGRARDAEEQRNWRASPAPVNLRSSKTGRLRRAASRVRRLQYLAMAAGRSRSRGGGTEWRSHSGRERPPDPLADSLRTLDNQSCLGGPVGP